MEIHLFTFQVDLKSPTFQSAMVYDRHDNYRNNHLIKVDKVDKL